MGIVEGKEAGSLIKEGMKTRPDQPMAITSSIDDMSQILSPRTQRMSRNASDFAEEGVELSLLGAEERRQAARGYGDEDGDEDEDDAVRRRKQAGEKKSISQKDKRAMVLLCVLCEWSLTHI